MHFLQERAKSNHPDAKQPDQLVFLSANYSEDHASLFPLGASWACDLAMGGRGFGGAVDRIAIFGDKLIDMRAHIQAELSERKVKPVALNEEKRLLLFGNKNQSFLLCDPRTDADVHYGQANAIWCHVSKEESVREAITAYQKMVRLTPRPMSLITLEV